MYDGNAPASSNRKRVVSTESIPGHGPMETVTLPRSVHMLLSVAVTVGRLPIKRWHWQRCKNKKIPTSGSKHEAWPDAFNALIPKIADIKPLSELVELSGGQRKKKLQTRFRGIRSITSIIHSIINLMKIIAWKIICWKIFLFLKNINEIACNDNYLWNKLLELFSKFSAPKMYFRLNIFKYLFPTN